MRMFFTGRISPGMGGFLLAYLLVGSPIAFASDDTGLLAADRAVAVDEPVPTTDWGLWPQLNILLRLPEDYQLRYPDIPRPPDEPVVYEKAFPLFAQQAIDRGFALPPAWGISLIGVENKQGQDISDLSVSLGKVAAPPPDGELVDLPFVDSTMLSVIPKRCRSKVICGCCPI